MEPTGQKSRGLSAYGNQELATPQAQGVASASLGCLISHLFCIRFLDTRDLGVTCSQQVLPGGNE